MTCVVAGLAEPARARQVESVPADAGLAWLAADGLAADGLAARSAALTAAQPEFEMLVSAYQRTYPLLGRARAERAVKTQDLRILLRSQLFENDPAGYGGSWYDPVADVEHVGAVTAATERAVRNIGRQVGINTATTRVAHSYRDLELLADKVKWTDLASSGVRDAAVDVVSNSVVVSVDPGQAARARGAVTSLLARDGVTAAGTEALRLVESNGRKTRMSACTSRNSCGNPPRSGITLWVGNKLNNPTCSLGFTAATATTPKSRWVITAGHCIINNGGVNVTWGHGEQYFGPARSAWHANGVDVGRIRIDNSYWATGGYLYSEAVGLSPAHLARLDNVVQSRSWIATGDGVCLDAMYGGICGPILGIAPAPSSIGVDADSCLGDSGGGWYWPGGIWGRMAYGIQSSSETQPPWEDDSCHEDGLSYFTAIPDITHFWDVVDAVGAHLRIESACPPDSLCRWH